MARTENIRDFEDAGDYVSGRPSVPSTSKPSYSSPSYLTNGKYDPEKALAAMYKGQLQDFYEYQKPILDSLVKESESDELTRMGELQASTLRSRSEGRVERTMGFGLDTLLPSQRAAMASRMDRDIRTSEGGIRRSAQLAQQAHQTATRTNIMSIAESLQTTGVAGVSSAAAAKAQRDEAAAAAKGSMMGQILGIAGGIAGSFIGPIGAQAGATIGGMAGGAIGGR